MATGNYLRMPFNRCNVGSEQGLIDDPVLGQGRDPLAPLQDVINDEDDIVLPVDPCELCPFLRSANERRMEMKPSISTSPLTGSSF